MRQKIHVLLLTAALTAALLSGCSQDAPALYEAGMWNGSTYDSTFLALSFTLPEGWTAADDQELSQMDEAAEGALDQQLDSTQDAREPVFHYALLAKAEDGSTGVTVVAQKAEMSAKDYVRALQRGTEDASYTLGETYTQTLSGQEYTVVPVTMSDGALQRQYLRSTGGYLINVMTFAPDEAGFSAIETAFSLT